jgi:integrase/recombinase XerC
MTSELTVDVKDFVLHLEQERRMSIHTVSAYQRDLNRCIVFMEEGDLSSWYGLKTKQIRLFIAQLNREGLSARSIQRHLSSLRSFYRYLIREGKVLTNPAQVVQAPKVGKRLPSTLDVDQVTGLLDHVEQKSFLGCRDRAMMELFYSSGLRLAELARLDCRDIDLADKLVYVTGKGNKARVLPIGGEALKAIQIWLANRDKEGLFEAAALFITKGGGRLGVRSIQQRLNFWGKKQGLSDHVHPHRLRHAFASHMLEATGDLRAVQELLGHADISTTQVYTHVDFQHLAKVYDRAHPRAKNK